MSTGKMTKEKLVENRQQEIIRACEELYERMEYDEINIKEIAKSTSICRSNIYNYYETKDEIFLDILKKEYLLWMEDMDRRMREDEEGGRERGMMDKIKFVTETGETAEFYVEEQTRVAGRDYLLVTDSLEDEASAYILRDMSSDGDQEAEYVMVEDEAELEAVSRIFAQMMDDVEIEM